MSLRRTFEERFGKEQADRIVAAAMQHKNGVHDNFGNDIFAWAILICMGYECLTTYKECHAITLEYSEIEEWIKEHRKEFQEYTGDVDYISIFTGTYDVIRGE